MRTNIEIDDILMAEAMAALGCRTKKETVETSLRLALRSKLQQEILDLVDPDTFWPGYDPEEGEEAEQDGWDRDVRVPSRFNGVDRPSQ